jgi:hypothetical protein
MFGPNRSEGRRLSTQLPEEVSVPEDDADAMQIICCVLHHRNDLVSETITAKMILRIAVEVDKYDLKTALKYTSLDWLKPQIKFKMKETGRLLAAAYLFDNTNAFAAHTKSLILNCNELYLNLVKDKLISQVLPSEILRM